MTLRLVDIASHQAGMDLAAVKAAGVSLVNIKTGQGNWYTHTAAKDWADKARQLGLGISTFHWLDNSASGAAQARIAYQRMKDIGGPDGMGHQCDNEDVGGYPPHGPATWAITRDYTDEMQQLMGRHIAMYTGDWWWTDPSRRWNGANLTPYLWASANAGYLGSYPGDGSTHWRAGYGGWSDLSLLQYAVGPIAGAGGGNLSKTAIRDPQVWAALTGTPTTPITKEDTVEKPYDGWLWAATERARAALAGTDAVFTIPGETTPRREENVVAKAIVEIRGQLAALAGKDFTDEPAIVAGVLTGLGVKPAAEVAAALVAAGQDPAALRDELAKLATAR